MKNFKMAYMLLFAACTQMILAFAPNKPVEASDYAAEFSQKAATALSTTNAVDGSSLGGAFAAGDYLAYKSLDFGTGGYKKFMLMLSADAANAGKKIEVRLDSSTGTKVGEITLTDTKGSQIFKEHYADITAITGVHDVYLVFPEPVNVDLDFFLFTTYMFTPYAGTDNGVYYNTGGLAITETKEDKAARMQWWNDARYGMFIHFGAYSYLGGRTLNSTTGAFTGTIMSSGVEWIMKRMAPADAFPKDIYRQYCSAAFNPNDFNAKNIVQLAKDAGMKYITITSRHHEGFSMYDTNIRDFKDYKITKISNGGNFNRDLIRELADECRAQGIHFTAYVSLVDWYDKTMYPIYGTKGGYNSADITAGFNGATVEERSVNKADYMSRLKGQLKELIVDYGAESIWFDCRKCKNRQRQFYCQRHIYRRCRRY